MDGAKFNFIPQQDRTTFLNNKNISKKLMQWSMKGGLKLKHYNFNEPLQPYQTSEFVKAFFKNVNVYQSLETYQNSSWSAIGDTVEEFKFELVPSTELSMSFFDRILKPENGIILQGGDIRQCLEEKIGHFYISNCLGIMLLDENSELYSLYSKPERQEFIFKLFTHLVLGGQYCQWDDRLRPYLDTVKAIYKDLMSVEREEGTDKIKIRSIVLKIDCKDNEGRAAFPLEPDNPQNFCYLIVDPFKRTVAALYHSYDANLAV